MYFACLIFIEKGHQRKYFNDKIFAIYDANVALWHIYIIIFHLQGCPSWKWFYPYHYAPFASDFKNITMVSNDFDRGTTPFAPLEKLMGVFPTSSGKFLPPSWRELMMRDVS